MYTHARARVSYSHINSVPDAHGAKKMNIIEEEHLLVNKLVLSAKHGLWDDVWKLLGDSPLDNQQATLHQHFPTWYRLLLGANVNSSGKAYLINAIPEGRRWGILHQALFWKKENVLKKLLQFPSCDPKIITKQYTTHDGEKTHDSAVEVAKKQGFLPAVGILENHVFKAQDQETFLPANVDIDRQGTSIIAITLAAYKNTFHPNRVDPSRKVFDILQTIYNKMNTTDSWTKIRDIIYDYAFVIDAGETIGNSKTRQTFYEAFIKIYTDEDTWFYDIMNIALRKQKPLNYAPSGNDLAIGPFVVTFQMIILFWDKLPRESGITYRRVMMSGSDLKKYREGVTFAWYSFVSSAKDPTYAKGFPTVEPSGDQVAIFHIDNSKESFWRPRNISQYSTYCETERLYPIGTRFKVSKVTRKDEGTYINIELQ